MTSQQKKQIKTKKRSKKECSPAQKKAIGPSYTIGAIVLSVAIIFIPLYLYSLCAAVAKWFELPHGQLMKQAISEGIFIFVAIVLEIECVCLLITVLRRKKIDDSFKIFFCATIGLALISFIFLVTLGSW